MRRVCYSWLMISMVAFLLPWPSRAQVFSQSETVSFANNVNLIVEAGSSAVMTGNQTSVTFVIPDGGFVGLKYPGPNAGLLLNTAGEPACRSSNGDNFVSFTGPLQVTIVPDSGTLCTQGGTQVLSSSSLSLTVQQTVGGVYHAGDTIFTQWNTSTAVGVDHIRIRLRNTDTGSFTTVVDNLGNLGTTSFIAPSIEGTINAVVRVEAVAFEGTVLAYGEVETAFALIGPEPEPEPVPEPEPTPEPSSSGNSDFSPSGVAAVATSIDVDKGLLVTTGSVLCAADSLIKASQASVYYCGRDGKRYVFPNEKTYMTWYSNFNTVVTLTDDVMAQITIGGNATYRPGVRMVKITTDPRVYVVSNGGILREIPDEATAASLYGADWAKQVDDVPDAFFVNYVLGAALPSASS